MVAATVCMSVADIGCRDAVDIGCRHATLKTYRNVRVPVLPKLEVSEIKVYKSDTDWYPDATVVGFRAMVRFGEWG